MPAADAPLTRANATLQRGASFLARELRDPSASCPPRLDGRYRAKVIGNGLRELDRFLNVLVAETATTLNVAMPRGERNTANALRRLRRAIGAEDRDHARLTALGRSRDCLFYCAGVARRGDRRGDRSMTIGWPDPAHPSAKLRTVALGDTLDITGAELAESCEFYAALGTDLHRLAATRSE